MTHPTLKPLLTPNEYLTEMRGTIGRHSLYGLLRAGKVKHIRIGRKILIPRNELTDFVDREAEAHHG